MTEPLLEVRNLKKHYPITKGMLRREVGRVYAVDGVTFELYPGETLGLVGESGCGKSTAARTVIRLEEPTDGEIWFDGEDISYISGTRLRAFRRRAQMIFQDPTSSFDPRMTIGEAVAEPLRVHGMTDRARRRRIVENLLERVGLSADDADRYPHELSGGQRQRVALARALVVNPEMIIADEPVSALDVSIQAQILSLIEELQAEFDLSILFISHDMGVVREVCDRVAVMYLGEIVEQGPAQEVFERARHPYTESLLASIPVADPKQRHRGRRLTGDVPDPSNPPPGCRFHTRCPKVISPASYNLEQPEWRAMMDLRVRLRERGIDVEAVREFVGMREGLGTPGRGDGRTQGVAGDDAAAMDRAIREEFGVPEQLSDPQAEAVLDDALDLVLDDDTDGARELLAAEFATPCELEPPATHAEGGHPAACHLHDERFAPGDGETGGRSAGSPSGDR